MMRKTQDSRIELISSEQIYAGPAFSVFRDFVREGKHASQRDVVRHTGSVVIMAVDESKEKRTKKSSANTSSSVLLIRQYRYAADMNMWELPAGRIDTGENKLAAAKRELIEETGVRAKSWKRMFDFYASPGFLDETMDVYLARDLTFGQATPEEDEQIRMRLVPVHDAIEMVFSKQIRDAKTISALLWFYIHESSQK